MSNHPPEPTRDQCNSDAELPQFNGFDVLATWYPQMGGYCGKCVVLTKPGEPCFEVYVWHDGEFPFGGVDEAGNEAQPVHLHHCNPDQFLEFAMAVKKAQKE